MNRFCLAIYILFPLCVIMVTGCRDSDEHQRDMIIEYSRQALEDAKGLADAHDMIQMVDSMEASAVNDLVIADMALNVSSFLFQNGCDNELAAYTDAVSPEIVALDANRDSLEIRVINMEMMNCAVLLDLALYDRTQYELEILLERARRLKLEHIQSIIYNNMASVAIARKDYDKAIELQQKSLEISQALNDREGIIYSYNNLASPYKSKGNDSKVVEYRIMSLHLLDQPEDSMLKMLVTRNLANDYLRMKEYSMAEKNLVPVLDYYRCNGVDSEIPLTEALYARILAQQGRTAEAEALFRSAYDKSNQLSVRTRRDIISDYAEFACEHGAPYLACELLKNNAMLADSLEADIQGARNTTIAGLYERELAKSQNIREQLSEANSSIKVAMWCISGLLVVTIVIFIYFLMRERWNSRQIISLRKAADERYSGCAILLEHLREFTKALVPQLHEVQNLLAGRNSRKGYDELRRITASVMQEVNASTETPLEIIDTDFKNKLLTRYPMLTSKDLRLCTLLMQGYSSKEIARISCSEVRSIDTARNRLRKKIGLPPKTDLNKFFITLAAEK